MPVQVRIMWNYAGLCSHCGFMPNALTMGAFMPELCPASGGGPNVEQCQALQVVAAWHPEDSDGVHQPPIREVHADGLMLIREDPTLDEEKERHSSGPAIPLPIGGADSKEDTKTEEAQE